MQLSKNFTLEELVASSTAKQLRISNAPGLTIIANLKHLSVNLLQPIRDKFGRIDVTSGYRCQTLNKAVGGSITSNHLYGYAADIQCKNHDLKEIYNYVVTKLNFDECFFEQNKKGVRWLHLAYRKDNTNRRKCNPNYKA